MAKVAFANQNAADKLKMDVEANQPHRATPKHMQMTLDCFAKGL